MTPTAALPLPELSPEVLAFAAEKGVADYLPAVAALTRRIFPHQRIDVLVEQDPELSYNRQIVFEVDQGEMDAAEMFSAHNRWTNELFKNCPATHVHVFCLGWA